MEFNDPGWCVHCRVKWCVACGEEKEDGMCIACLERTYEKKIEVRNVIDRVEEDLNDNPR